MRGAFKDHNACALTDNKTVTVAVERPARVRRIVIPGGENAHTAVSVEHHGCYCRLRTPGDYHVGLTGPDHHIGQGDVVTAGRAGAHDGEIRPGYAEIERDHARRHVRDCFGNIQKVAVLRPFGEKRRVLFFEHIVPAGSGAHEAANPRRIHRCKVETRLRYRFDSGVYGELGKPGHAAALLFGNADIRIKTGHFAGNFAVMILSVEPRYARGSGNPVAALGPEVIHAVPQRRYNAQSGYNNVVICHRFASRAGVSPRNARTSRAVYERPNRSIMSRSESRLLPTVTSGSSR